MKSSKLTVNYNGQPTYQISIEDDYENLPSVIKELQVENRKLMIVSDSTVSKYYLNECKSILTNLCASVHEFVFEAGEKNKNLDTIEACYEALIQAHFDRNDVLVALGGGVVGDMTGFIAATYLRGIRFIQLPTSLLAMVDSSIGGKTGVDFKSYKNMVGAFHQPKAVYINLSTLKTLKRNEFTSGMSEIVKHSLIKDKAYYTWLKSHNKEILEHDFDTLREMIYRSCEIKRDVVECDPTEKGERALLNFGHTIGHAVEKLMNFQLLHGECVSIGSVAASFLSYLRGYITMEEYEDIRATFAAFEQPVTIQGLSISEIIETTKHDKKMDGNTIKFILLEKIGHAYIDTTITDDELASSIERLES